MICSVLSIRVNIVFDGQQVVAHGLEGELMKYRWHRVKSPVQDDELGAGLIWTLQHGKHARAGMKPWHKHTQSIGFILKCLLKTKPICVRLSVSVSCRKRSPSRLHHTSATLLLLGASTPIFSLGGRWDHTHQSNAPTAGLSGFFFFQANVKSLKSKCLQEAHLTCTTVWQCDPEKQFKK